MIVIDREKHIGAASEPRVVDVEKGFLQFIAKATGETDPAYFDEETASVAGYPGLPMPPTYLFSPALSVPARHGDLFDKENDIRVDVARLLHGEQSFTYHKPVYAGDRLTLTTTTGDIYAKKGGALQIIV